MKIDFLEAKMPLSKTIGRNDDRSLRKTSYPMAKNFTSHSYEVAKLSELKNLIELHASQAHCLIKGRLTKALQNEPRRGCTSTTDETQWLCLDIDGSQSVDTAEQFITICLPEEFQHAGYIEQVSSTHGLTDTYSAHLFFLLDRPVAAPLIKEWLKHINLTIPRLEKELKLNKDGCSLKWMLDITVCQNDKLIYIAPAKLEDGLRYPPSARITLVNKQHEHVALDTTNIDATRNETAEHATIDTLRAVLYPGAPKKRAKFKWEGANQVLTNPDKMTLVGQPFTERGFTYLPITDNPYTYWHPEDKPALLHNFRGAPTVRTADVLPDYWAQIQEQLESGQSTRAFVFRDWRTDRYFNALFDGKILEMHTAGSKDKLSDFLANFDLELPKPIPDYKLAFEPQNETLIDTKKRFINLFQPTKYMRDAKALPAVTRMPPMIYRIIHSAAGADNLCYDYFLNWLAYTWQYRKKTNIAWILQGIEGTGKGLIYHKILRPLFGDTYCNIVKLQDFDDVFTAWRETCLILFVDEVEIGSASNQQRMLAALKNMITEPTGRVRAMRTDPYQANFFENLIFATNEIGAMKISESDRRFNVAPRQEHKLIMSDEDLAQLENELTSFACYLEHYPVNVYNATNCLINEAKNDMRRDAMSSHDAFMIALKEGDFEFFASAYHDRPGLRQMESHMEYQNVIKAWAQRIVTTDNSGAKVTRDEMMRIYDYMQAGKITTPNKFTSMLKHRGLKTSRMDLPDVSGKPYGLIIDWANGYQLAKEIVAQQANPNLKLVASS